MFLLLGFFYVAQERANCDSRRTFCLMRLDPIGPGSSGDIQMRPLGFIDEFLNEDRTHDSAGLATRSDVLYIRNIRLDLFAVFLANRKLPKVFTGLLAALDDVVNQALVIAHDTGINVAESDNDRAGKGRHIDDFRGTILFRVGDRVRQDQSSFRVRIEYFDGFAIACRYNIARPRSLAV